MPPTNQTIRVLTFSTLYPNAAMEGHGVFVENRARHLALEPDIELCVVAPVPWFPFRSGHFGRYGAGARAPQREVRHGVTVTHPRYPHLPSLGAGLAPWTIYRAALRQVSELIADGFDIDVIDAHYLHPDGAAAALLARRFDRPLVLTARGSDVTQLPRFRLRRRAIRNAIAQADGLVAVCRALVPDMVPLGAAADAVTVLRNGVDLQMFHPPADRAALRARLGLDDRPVLISVGHMVERKGHHIVIDALRELDGHSLLLVGEGPERRRLEQQAEQRGLGDRVRFLGARPHAQLAGLYGAADALVLASSREGWANVLLEAMACGTPAVATGAGGTPEVVSAPAAGVLAAARTPAAVAAGVRALFAHGIDRAATRAHAERHPWTDTSSGQVEVFRRAIAAHSRGRR